MVHGSKATMTQGSGFRQQLRNHLEQHADRVLLRIIDNGKTLEFTGKEILATAESVANRYSQASPGSVVLILLPHSWELFLLHLGLVLTGRIPAILAWPTTRIDPEKYHRNLLHQLVHLPADEIVTVPKLALTL